LRSATISRWFGVARVDENRVERAVEVLDGVPRHFLLNIAIVRHCRAFPGV